MARSLASLQELLQVRWRNGRGQLVLDQIVASHRGYATCQPLRSLGVLVLDVTGEELPGALVDRYLAVKRDGLL